MLVLERLAIFFAALGCAKYGLIDRRAPLTTLTASMVLFSAWSISAWYIQVPTGNGIESTTAPGLGVLGFGLALFMMAMVLLEALNKLPEHPVNGVLKDSATTGRRQEAD